MSIRKECQGPEAAAGTWGQQARVGDWGEVSAETCPPGCRPQRPTPRSLSVLPTKEGLRTVSAGAD